MQICDYKNCTACYACLNSCPKNAISFKADIYGRTLPSIDFEKCVSCGICKKICPENNPLLQVLPAETYAVWSKNETDKNLSSSGGVAAVFSKNIINSRGVVFGSAVKDKKAMHIKAEAIEDTEMLRGSKYVHSEIGTTYREAEESLKSGKTVLFTGTPCQIAGLKAFLKKDYDNLITVDLICHGTPPLKYLEEHLDTVCKDKWDSFSFRGKNDFNMVAYKATDVLYLRKHTDDLYFKSFLDALTYRESCYECRYAKPERVSDITIGDFWGLNRNSLKTPYKGRISVVLVNSDKGKEFFEKCKDDFVFERRELSEALSPEQRNLHRPSRRHAERELFLENYVKFGFDNAVKKTKLGKEINKSHILTQIRSTIVWKFLRKAKYMFR